MIEQVQQRATKIIPVIRNLNYENRFRKLELTTLKDRRLRRDLTQILKIMNKYNRFKIIFNQVEITDLDISKKLQGNQTEKISFTTEL